MSRSTSKTPDPSHGKDPLAAVAPPRGLPEVVELTQHERIAARGTETLTWFWRAQAGDGWVNVGDLATDKDRLDPGPGMVWETRFTLNVPRGSQLMRVRSRPRQEQPKSPLDYLTRDARKPARQTQRSYFTVASRGNLERVVDPSADQG